MNIAQSKGRAQGYTDEQWQARVDLAAAHRAVVRMTDGTPLEVPPGGSVLLDSDAGAMFAVAPREGFEDAVLGFVLVDEAVGEGQPTNILYRRVEGPEAELVPIPAAPASIISSACSSVSASAAPGSKKALRFPTARHHRFRPSPWRLALHRRESISTPWTASPSIRRSSVYVRRRFAARVSRRAGPSADQEEPRASVMRWYMQAESCTLAPPLEP